jgi:hypothetical protein
VWHSYFGIVRKVTAFLIQQSRGGWTMLPREKDNTIGI